MNACGHLSRTFFRAGKRDEGRVGERGGKKGGKSYRWLCAQKKIKSISNLDSKDILYRTVPYCTESYRTVLYCTVI